jgi:hypothetical protein
LLTSTWDFLLFVAGIPTTATIGEWEFNNSMGERAMKASIMLRKRPNYGILLLGMYECMQMSQCETDLILLVMFIFICCMSYQRSQSSLVCGLSSIIFFMLSLRLQIDSDYVLLLWWHCSMLHVIISQMLMGFSLWAILCMIKAFNITGTIPSWKRNFGDNSTFE